MKLQTMTTQDAELIVSFIGDFDADGMQTLQAEFDHLGRSNASHIILDLARVDLIDSSGIGAIVFLYKRLKVNGHSMSLTGLHGQPELLIKMLRIHATISVTCSNDTPVSITGAR